MVNEQSPFCPACRAPLIRVQSRQPDEESPVLPPPPPPVPGFNAIQPSLIQTSVRINWKAFLRTALPLASFAGLIVVVFAPVGWLLVFPLSVVFSIRMYSRRQFQRVSPGQGAVMGIADAMIAFALSAVLFVVLSVRNPADYRKAVHQAVQSLQEIEDRNPDGPRFSQVFLGPGGTVLFTGLALISLLVILLVIGIASGVLAVVLARGSQ